MGCEVPDVRLTINDLAILWVRCRPATAADKLAGLYLRNIVSAGSQQGWISTCNVRQGTAQQVMVIARCEQAGIAGYE